MNTDTILLILLLVINIMILLGKAYFTEKGKNLATKENIEEITKKIESEINGIVEFEKYIKMVFAGRGVAQSNIFRMEGKP